MGEFTGVSPLALQVKTYLKTIVQWLIPARCLLCQQVLEEKPGLCPDCWMSLQFISDPCCCVCGVPFDYEVNGAQLKCLKCLKDPPFYDKARSVGLYDGPLRDMILRFKHADATYMAAVFANWMVRIGADMIYQSHGLIPVPLHWSRLIRRRYNQAALLSNRIASLTGVGSYPSLLKRTRRTAPQGSKNKHQRRTNIRDAFVVSDPSQITGRDWCLIDDVLASGATASECARVLKAAGARSVFVITLATPPLHQDVMINNI